MTQDETGRRRFLRMAGATGAVGLGGCLRLTADQQSTSTPVRETETRETSTDGTESAANGLFATKEEALEYVGKFARDGASPVEPFAGEGPELIRFTGSGTSAGSGEDGGIYTSQDIMVETVSESGIAFGGGADRALRVRNVTFDTAATFHPAPDTKTLRATEFDIDAEEEGTPPTSIGVETPDSRGQTDLRGSWEGDRELFRRQAFSTYVVEMLEGGASVGRTEGGIRGISYYWGAKQTRDALYVTRQPSVGADWNVQLLLGDEPHRAQAEVDAEHLVDANAFRIDLTALDLPTGRYGWSLRIGGESSSHKDTYLRMSPFRSEVLLV